MPVVSPFAVASTLDEAGQGFTLVFAMGALAAKHIYLQRKHGIGEKRNREKIIKAGDVRATETAAYAAMDHQGRVLGQYYAISSEQALVKRADRWPRQHLSVKRTDDINLLMELSDAELVEHARYIWPGLKRDGALHTWAPAAWARVVKGRKDALSKASRLQIACAIRLAMVVPRFGPEEPPPPARGRVRLHGIHGHRVQHILIHDMFEAVGPEMKFFTDETRGTIKQFCAAYDLEADQLPWSAIAVLWTEGIDEFRKEILSGR